MERAPSQGAVPDRPPVDLTAARSPSPGGRSSAPCPQQPPGEPGAAPDPVLGVAAGDRVAVVHGLLAPAPDQLLLYAVGADGSARVAADGCAGPRALCAGPLPADLADTDVHADDADLLGQWLAALPGLGDDAVESATLRLRRSGTWRWYDVRATVFDRTAASGGSPSALVLVCARDVQEQVEAVRRLAAGERAFRELFDRSPTAMCLADDHDRFVEVNEAACRLLGRPHDELVSTVFDALVHPTHRAGLAKVRGPWLTGSRAEVGAELLLVHAEGTELWVRVRLVGVVVGDRPLTLMTLDDITATKDLEQRLRHDGLHDPLTRLPNRRLVVDRLEGALARARRSDGDVAVFLVSIDGLRRVNDLHGHAAGDAVLTAMAGGLRAALREHDTLGRLGGDCFVAVCEDLGRDSDVDAMGQGLLAATRRPVRLPDTEVTVDGWVGIAVPASGHDTADSLLRQADAAMLRARTAGSDQVARTDGGVVGAARISLDAELRDALDTGALELHAQPLVDTAGLVHAVETLLRWNHPARGLLQAVQFADLLEGADMALPLAEWSVARAVADASRVGLGDDVLLVVNVPVRALLRPALGDAARAALGRYGRDPESLVLQVREADLQLLSRRGTSPRALDRSGAVLGVERFGAETGPVAALRRRTPALLTLERALLVRAVEDPAEAEFLAGIVAATRALGITTVAQGVESPAHLAMARDCGVDLLQGHLVGRPGPWEALEGTAAQARVTLSVASRLPEMRRIDG